MSKLIMSWGISDFGTNVIIKLLMASICGALIGFERGMRGRSAGLKTFSLVCLGSTLIMVTNDYIYNYVSCGTGDIVRLPAQVISGIGFLCAGSIIVTGHNQVKGLTTAATLWVTAALGIAIGAGFYLGAIVGLVIIFISSLAFRYIDNKIVSSSRMLKMYMEVASEDVILDTVKYLRENNIKVTTLKRKSEKHWYSKDICAVIEVNFENRVSHEKIINAIKMKEGVNYIEEI